MKYIIIALLLVSCNGLHNSQQTTQKVLAQTTTIAIENTLVKATQFGAIIQYAKQDNGAVAFKTNIAGQLELDCVRDGISMDNPKPRTMLDSQYPVLLNINSSATGTGKLIKYATDTVSYKKKLREILVSLPRKPVCVFIENEPLNPKFYSGNVKQYINQLKAAGTVCRELGIPYADGGLTSPAIYCLATGRGSLSMKEQAGYAKELLTAEQSMDIAFTNFHSSQDSAQMVVVGQYLQSNSNKPVISNEYGSMNVRATVNAVKILKLPYAIWYSGSERALQSQSGYINAFGQIYKEEIKK